MCDNIGEMLASIDHNKEGAGGLFERGLLERGLLERGLLERGLLERGLTRKGGLLERGAK